MCTDKRRAQACATMNILHNHVDATSIRVFRKRCLYTPWTGDPRTVCITRLKAGARSRPRRAGNISHTRAQIRRHGHARVSGNAQVHCEAVLARRRAPFSRRRRVSTRAQAHRPEGGHRQTHGLSFSVYQTFGIAAHYRWGLRARARASTNRTLVAEQSRPW